MRVIDAHVHIQPWSQLKPEVKARFFGGREDGAWLESLPHAPDEMVRYLDRCGVERAVLINYPSPDLMGFDDSTNDFVAGYRDAHPDRFIACGGVHPRLTPSAAAARKAMDRICGRLRISMIKLHPPHQRFDLDGYQRGNEALAAIYEKAAEHGVPIMVHSGTSVFPGARSRLGDPMPMDDVCLDFPRTKFILAHLGRPLWGDHAFFLLRRHKNLWADASGIPPKTLLQFFPRLAEVADRVLFGTDWPSPGVKDLRSNLEAFRALPLPEELMEKILYRNAASLLGLPSAR
ncbi:MAG: amidohydrolase [Planctomycetes bacterium]|nr:amidohydrolase [Planctomycetota bacterium]